jgi:hypothetical protein
MNDRYYGYGKIVQEAARYRVLRDMYGAASEAEIVKHMLARDAVEHGTLQKIYFEAGYREGVRDTERQ